MKSSLTKGPITKSLLLFALPMMAGNLLQQIYNIVDTLVVGRFVGAKALAAVGSAYTLMTFLTSLITGLCMGSGALFSMRYGAGEKKALRQDVWLSFWFIAGITVVILLFVFPGTDLILRMLQTPEDVYEPMRMYTSIIFGGIGFIFLYNYFAFFLRSLGESATPLVALGGASILNIVLDLLFVIRFGWGVSGAAIATVISQAVAGLGLAAYVGIRKREWLPDRSAMKWNRKRMREIIESSLLTGMQQSVMNFGILMIQGLVNSFGSVIMAAFAASTKIDTIAYMPSQEFANAYSIFVSQNHGAGEQGRIKHGTRQAFLLSSVFCLGMSLLIWFLAAPLMRLFVDGSETAIIAEGVRYLRMEGACYIGIGMLFLWYAYYRGIQVPGYSLVLTVISLGTRVVLAYALAPHTPLGPTAIYLAIPIGWGLADLAGTWRYWRHRYDH